MAHGHRRPATHPLLTGVTAALAVAIVVGMVALWPSDGQPPEGAELLRRGEIVATEIVRTLVGSIGLVAAMPITTWLAASVVAREPAAGLGTNGWKSRRGESNP